MPVAAAALLLLLLVGPATAAVVYDNSQFDEGFSGTSLTGTNFTVSGAANSAAILSLHFSTTTVTGVSTTFGGVSGVLIASTTVTSPSGSFLAMMYCVTAPPSGSQHATASWTTSSGLVLSVTTATGVDQTTPCTNGGTVGYAGANPAPPGLTITSNNGDLTVTAARQSNSTVDMTTTGTITWNKDHTAKGDRGPGTGTFTHSWSGSGAFVDWAITGANFVAAAAGGVPVPTTLPSGLRRRRGQ